MDEEFTPIRTPVTLHWLNDEQAMFVGQATEQVDRPTMIGPVEVTQRFPSVGIQREVWDDIGRPTKFFLRLEQDASDLVEEGAARVINAVVSLMEEATQAGCTQIEITELVTRLRLAVEPLDIDVLLRELG